jgi:hypothetical protein
MQEDKKFKQRLQDLESLIGSIDQISDLNTRSRIQNSSSCSWTFMAPASIA